MQTEFAVTPFLRGYGSLHEVSSNRFGTKYEGKMSNQSSTFVTVEAAVAEKRTWFMILGVVLIVLGIAAIAFPFATTIAAKMVFGWVFLIGGIAQIMHAFSTQRWSAFLWNVLIGALYLIAGIWLAFFPLTGIITLTVFLAPMFVIKGLFEVALALGLREQEGWIWLLISGLISLAVGVLIYAQLPSSAIWAIGLLVGINMISSGWAYFFLGLAASKKA